MRRRLAKVAVDAAGWRHPRPSADPRLLALVIGLSWVAFAQTFLVRPESAVTTKAFEVPAAIAVATLVAFASGLLLYAAFCDSQVRSWVVEAGACLAFAVQCVIQFLGLVSVNTDWWATSTFAWTVFWGGGNLIRFCILIGRLRG